MSFDSTVLADSPVAYLKLAEASGTTAADTSGNGHTGTYNNCTLGQAGLISGESDTSVLFNGTNSFVDLGNPAALNILGQFAMEAIVSVNFPGSGSSIYTIGGKGYDGTNQDFLRVVFNLSVPSKTVDGGTYQGSDNTTYAATHSISWPSAQAHIVAYQYTGSQWELYIDGIPINVDPGSVGQLASSSNFYIGAEDRGSLFGPFSGKIEKVSIYNTSLSGARWLAHAVAGGFATGLPTLQSATIPSSGTQVNLTYDISTTGLTADGFSVVADGTPIKITSVSGAGTSWVLHFDRGYIYSGQSVKVSDLGEVTNNASVSGTNSSSVTKLQARYVARELGVFIHFSSATFGYTYSAGSPPTQAGINAVFNPSSYNMDQWLDAVQACGAKYAVLTTKHDAGFCLWPTQSGTLNIGGTPWFASNNIDIVKDFTTKARARGLGVGLYINFYDPWYLYTRTGHDGTYGPPSTYTAYISQQITELLTNYGAIDILWTDSWGYSIGYTNAPYATIYNLIKGLQPNCELSNNTHDLIANKLTHSDIAIYEGGGVEDPPLPTNLVPAEFCRNVRSDNSWVWQASGQDSYVDPKVIGTEFLTLLPGHSSYLINFPPNDLGLLPASNVTYASSLGAILGKRGGAVYPIPANVKSGVVMPDGTIGTLTAGGGGGGGTVPVGELETSFSNDSMQVSTFKMVMNLWLSANAGGYTGAAPNPTQTEAILLRQAVDITSFLAQ